MRKYFLFVVLLAVGNLQLFAQSYSEGRIRDSIVIDSLHRQLPFLMDSARVDCLNTISEKSLSFYDSYNSDEFKHSGDSIYKYASMAYKEAAALNYKYGKAVSLLNLVLSYSARSNFRDSAFQHAVKDSLFKKYTQQALALAKEVQNNDLLGRVYYRGPDEEDRIGDYKKSITYYQKAGNEKMELEVTTALVWMYTEGIEDETAIDYADKCIQLAKKIVPVTAWEHELVQWSYNNMADLYKTAGDYETALAYIKLSAQYGKATHGMKEDIHFCELYYLLGQYDSAFYYWQNWKKDYDTYYFGHKAVGNTLLGKIYIKKGEYDKAIDMFNLTLNGFKKNGKFESHMEFRLIRPLLFIAEAYSAKKNYKTALNYANQGLGYAKQGNNRLSMIQGYELASRLHHHLHNNDSAYSFLYKYIILKDSLQNKQFIWRLNNYKKSAEDAKKESRIGFLNRDNQIKQQQLKQEATFRNFLIAVFIAIVFAGLYVFRNIHLKRKNERLKQDQNEQEWKLKQLESENKHVELQKQAAELEMQALRAQMNPHFIFNCLSSINRFILKNETKIASNYLTRFSRLIRMVLINSQKPLVALADELQMLGLYLEMERLRFKNSFDYGITFLNAIDGDNFFIPPLLLQPFCENAIWHGLMPKEGHGRLDIVLSMQDNILNCTITDNGVGREKAEELNSKTAEKEKSMGLKITTERLALLNREKGLQTYYEIEDLKDENGNAAGTKVIVKISFKESVEANI